MPRTPGPIAICVLAAWAGASACESPAARPTTTCPDEWREAHGGSAIAAGLVAVDGGELILRDRVPRPAAVTQSPTLTGVWVQGQAGIAPSTGAGAGFVMRVELDDLELGGAGGAFEVALRWAFGRPPAVVSVGLGGVVRVRMTGDGASDGDGALADATAGAAIEIESGADLALEARVLGPDGAVVATGRLPRFDGGDVGLDLHAVAAAGGGSVTARVGRVSIVRATGAIALDDAFECDSLFE